MNRIIVFVATIVGALYFLLALNGAWALTPEQVVTLKNAGVSEQTILFSRSFLEWSV
jgi:hypothetical protein